MKNIIFCFLAFVIFGCGGGGVGGKNVFNVPALPQKSESLSASVSGTSSVFVGYDDTGSTALKQLMKYQIDNGLTVSSEFAQPHEFLNTEEFMSEEMVEIGPFDISVGMLASDSKESGKILYNLGVNLKGPVLTSEDRPNIVLTYLIDTSGSMNSQTGFSVSSGKTKMNLVIDGLATSVGQLKKGDVLNIVLFSSKASVLIENYEHGVSSESNFLNQLKRISAAGSTNLELGLIEAYSLAKFYYDSEKKNRILVITDAEINTGETDAQLIVENTVLANKEGVLLSGLGIGYDYNAKFLEELSDAGSGNQFLVATDSDAEYAFSSGLFPLLMLAAKNLKVEIQYPNSLSHIASAAEQVANTADELKGVNFGFNSSQFYLERFKTDSSNDLANENINIILTYTDPITNLSTSATQSFLIGNILEKESSNIKDALAIVYMTNLIDGSKVWDDMEWEFDHVLKNHASELYAEYIVLIYKVSGKDINFNDGF